jgi:hypothetical protein
VIIAIIMAGYKAISREREKSSLTINVATTAIIIITFYS